MYVCVYIYIHICVHIYTYTYIERERERHMYTYRMPLTYVALRCRVAGFPFFCGRALQARLPPLARFPRRFLAGRRQTLSLFAASYWFRNHFDVTR